MFSCSSIPRNCPWTALVRQKCSRIACSATSSWRMTDSCCDTASFAAVNRLWHAPKNPLVLNNRSFSSASVIESYPTTQKIIIPPNLKFDPRSSFAPIEQQQQFKQPKRRQQRRPGEVSPTKPLVESQKEEISEEELQGEQEEDEEVDVVQYLTQPQQYFAIPLPDRLKVPVHTFFTSSVSVDTSSNLEGTSSSSSSVTGTLWLNETVFGLDPIRVDLLKRAVNYFRAKKRGMRTAKTKTISEVSGSGKKVRKQKGTGMARAGHKRPPHWRGGAKAHGPKNTTNYGNTKLNKKVRRLALRHVFSQKLKEGNLMVVNEMTELPTHKTKELWKLLLPWNLGGLHGHSALFLDHYNPQCDHYLESVPDLHGVPMNLNIASRNIPRFQVGNTRQANVYNILKHEKLILTVSAIQEFERLYRDD